VRRPGGALARGGLAPLCLTRSQLTSSGINEAAFSCKFVFIRGSSFIQRYQTIHEKHETARTFELK
jgi:hypothetical protein